MLSILSYLSRLQTCCRISRGGGFLGSKNLGMIRRDFPIQILRAKKSKKKINIPSQELTWNLDLVVSNRNLLFQGSIFRFRVCFGGVYGKSKSLKKNKKKLRISWMNLLSFLKGSIFGGHHEAETLQILIKYDSKIHQQKPWRLS